MRLEYGAQDSACVRGAEAEKPCSAGLRKAAGHGDLLGEVGVGVGRCALGSPWGGRDVHGAVDGAELDSCSVTWAWSRGMQTGGLCIFLEYPPPVPALRPSRWSLSKPLPHL